MSYCAWLHYSIYCAIWWTQSWNFINKNFCIPILLSIHEMFWLQKFCDIHVVCHHHAKTNSTNVLMKRVCDVAPWYVAYKHFALVGSTVGWTADDLIWSSMFGDNVFITSTPLSLRLVNAHCNSIDISCDANYPILIDSALIQVVFEIYVYIM